MHNFLSNPMWAGIGGFVTILVPLIGVLRSFFGTAKLKFGTMYGLQGSYLQTTKECSRSAMFALFFIANVRLNYAHNITVFFDSELFDLRINNLNTSGDKPQYDISNDDKGRTILNIYQLPGRSKIIINTCSTDWPSIVKVTADHGRAYPAPYHVRIQSQVMSFITGAVTYALVWLIVSVSAKLTWNWLLSLLS